MANWGKLNKEFDNKLNSMTSEDWENVEMNSMTSEDWDNWYENVEMKRINQNKMTAVEWFAKQVLRSRQLGFISNEKFNELLEQAKEMEKEQMIKFAKHCLDKSIDLDILMAYNQVEIEYTNQTFKSK